MRDIRTAGLYIQKHDVLNTPAVETWDGRWIAATGQGEFPDRTLVSGRVSTDSFMSRVIPLEPAVATCNGRTGVNAGILPIRGTWEDDREQFGIQEGLPFVPYWFRPHSLFALFLRIKYGLQILDFDGDPSTPNLRLWSGALQGTVAQGWFGRLVHTRDRDWMTGGERTTRLYNRWAPEYDEILSIGFSHGGQSAAHGLQGITPTGKYRDKLTLVTVDTPMRDDQLSWYEEAHREVRAWVHMHTTSWKVWVRWAGSRFGPETCQWADLNIPVQKHGGALYRPLHHELEWSTTLEVLGYLPCPGWREKLGTLGILP